jgi:hypothetical protein
VASMVALICAGLCPEKCTVGHYSSNMPYEALAGGIILLTNVILPPLLYLISATLMVLSLRRATRDHRSSALVADVRHVSITVLSLATLSFVCQFTYAYLVLFFIGKDAIVGKKTYSMNSRGRISGIAVITLPLLNAALFPLILIKRSSTLQTEFAKMIRDVPVNFMNNLARILSLRNTGQSSYDYL